MAARQLTLPSQIVKKSNALARARWSAESVWEPRLVALLASKVHTDDTDFHVYEIHVSEILQGAHSGRHYQEIESVIDKVMSRVLTIRDDDGWTKYNVFSRCRFRRSEGILELGFHPDLKPHYLNLQRYMKYNLMEFLLLPSIYSQRMFEFLKSWDDKQETKISLVDLYELINAPESFRKDFRQLRIRVLEKSHKDITSKTTLQYEWEPIKKGRSVVEIRFIFAKRRALPITKKKEDDAIEKQRSKNNSNFKAATACLKERGAACEGGHQKEAVCEVCRKIR